MKRDVSDERLQDYLDGRLSGDERAEIEALLEQDAELARRVEAWRTIGRALRGEPGELPPGFYARARERFEQSVRARPPWGFRLLSWEAAGLAAAVVLAAVLFVPEVLRNPDLPSVPSRAVEQLEDESRADRPAPTEAEARPKRRAQEILGKVAAPDDAARIADDRKGPAQPPASEKEDLAQLEGRRDRDADEPEPDWAPVPPQAAAPEIGWESAEAERQAAAAPPPPSPGRGEPAAGAEVDLAEEPHAEPVREKKGERAAKAAVTTEASSRVDRPETFGVVAAQAIDVPVVELPAEAAVEEGVRIVDRPADWEARLAGPAGPALSGLGGYDARRRLVLVGRADGVDCSSLTVRRDERGYRVRLARSGASAGCALLLPRDGLPVALEPATEE
jgi:negative regulator of sigma E activity